MQSIRIFCVGGARTPVQAMIAFIEDHRSVYGVEPICIMLPIAPASNYARLSWRVGPDKASLRQQRDATLRHKIQKVWDDHWQVYRVRKAWRQLCREGEAVARCTIARLMAGRGQRGAVRGKPIRTTIPDTSEPCPHDKVHRQFRASAPNMLWGCPLVRHWFEPNGRRLHLCLHLERLCLCGVRHRHLCQPHRWFEGVTLGQDRLRFGCP